MSNKHTTRFSARKRLIVAAIAACFVSAPAWGNPTAPQVVNGSASFNEAGKLLTVTNSNGAIINWNSFSIGANETTRFNQASAASSVLNRVIANDPSVLLGSLSSNGRVWLVNPAGILVGQGAKIDVAGFIASTLNVRNEDFLAGRLNFGATPGAGSIQNYGQITTPSGGSVYLIAPEVQNHGIINAPGGEVILAAGQTAQLIDTGTPGVQVDITGAEGNVTNLGEIVAEAGRIGMAGVLVKNSGTLDAASVVREGGRIFLKASRDAYVDGAGRIVATGTKGGSVDVLGERVAVMDQAQLDASGTNGGGQIRVGGDYQGKNPEVQNADRTFFGPQAAIRADATLQGDGGKVILWADDTMRAYGTISAKGGAQAGDGGFVETSGHRTLDVAGIKVDTSAAHGSAGNWLLDPTDISIVAGTGSGSFTGGVFDNGGGTSATVYGGDISTALNTTNVTIQTSSGAAANGDITVTDASIANNSTSARTLTLRADRAIAIADSTISGNSAGGSLGVTLNAAYGGGAGNVSIEYSSIATYGGAVVIGGGADPILNPAIGYFGGSAVTQSGVYIYQTSIVSGGGALDIRGTGYGTGTDNYGIYIYNSHLDTSGNGGANGGVVTLTGTGGSGSDNNHGVYLFKDSGGGAVDTTILTDGGALNVTGYGGGTGYNNYGIYVYNETLDSSKSDGSAGGKIELHGTGSNGTSYNNYNVGVSLNGGATIRTGGGNLEITGSGADGGEGRGIKIFYSSLDSSIANGGTGGWISLEGQGGGGNYGNEGVSLEYATIATGGGNLDITGYGGGTGGSNYGIYAYASSLDTSNGNTGGNVSLIGKGGDGYDWNVGVYLNGNYDAYTTIRTGGGDLEIVGVGGDGGEGRGIAIHSSALDTSRPDGNAGGTISLTGTGGSGDGDNSGVYLDYASVLTGGGDLNITGYGGGTGYYNYGIYAYSSILDTSNGNAGGNVSLIGKAGDGDDWNVGVYLDGYSYDRHTAITTGGGELKIDGTGMGTGGNNYGIDTYSAALDTSRLDGSTGGKITLIGTGGSGGEDWSYFNSGVKLDDDTAIRTGGGDIDIKGVAGGGDGAEGITIYSNTTLDSSKRDGSMGGMISLEGTGGSGDSDSNGVYLYYASIFTGGGDLYIKGTGGGSSIGSSGYGIYAHAADLDTRNGSGGGNVTLIGTGGNGDSDNSGILLSGYDHASTTISTGGGGLAVTGTGMGSGAYNHGIRIYNSVLDTSKGDGTRGGDISLTGYGSDAGSGNNHGILFDSGKSNIYASGDLKLNGYAGAGADSYAIGVYGSVVLRADSDGTGSGEVFFDGGTDIEGMKVTISEYGGVDLYYNPASYTDADPYSSMISNAGFYASWMLVNDAANLQAMETNLAGNYALGRNIDAGGTTGFVPISHFQGQFDGLNRTISNLDIDLPSTTDVGLFATLGGVVRNVGIVGGSVTGSENVGSLAGSIDNGGSVSNAFATGNVVYGGSAAGGLVGSNAGIIENAYATGKVFGNTDVGGLVGYNGNSISNVYASGNVNEGNTTATNVGGLIGNNDGGSVAYSYALGSVSGGDRVGGLVGNNHYGGSLSDSYSAGFVSGSTNYGGLVGYNGGTVSSSFWDTETSGTSTGIGGGTLSGAVGLSTTDAMQSSSYNYYGGWDFGNDWWMSDGNTRPFLRSESSTTIHNAHQVQLMATDLSANYKLSTDIDMSTELASGMWSTDSGFLPVGIDGYGFYGKFDGMNHALSNLVINRPGTDYVGLFSNVQPGGVVKNLGLVAAEVSGNESVGALAGKNYGSIRNSYSTGNVEGAYLVGGLVGYSEGSINGSYSSSSVSGTDFNIGGLVGEINGGEIRNSRAEGDVTTSLSSSNVGGLVGLATQNFGIYDSHASGDVTGGFDSNHVGGLVGRADNGPITISGAYAIGAVAGGDYVGGLIGYSRDVTIKNSYASGDVTATNYGGGLVGYNENGNYSSIRDSYAEGAVSGEMAVGGLVGYNEGNIRNSRAAGSVEGVDLVGGLVGWSYSGRIESSYSTATVNATGSTVGGLVGYNEDIIRNSYATGEVTGVDYVGGLVGENNGNVDNSYSTAVVEGTGSFVGGLVGLNNGGIRNAYAAGSVTGLDYVGGLVGQNDGKIDYTYSAGGVTSDGVYGGGLIGGSGESAAATNSYWNIDSSNQSASAGGNGKTDLEMKQIGTFDAWSIADAGGSTAVWRIYEGDTTPLLRSFLKPITVTANDASKVYDKVAFGGNGVTYSVADATLSGTPSYSGTSMSALNVGSYAIDAAGLYSDQQGYDISYASGILTITPRSLSVTATAANKVYDGQTSASVSYGDNRVAGDVLTLGGSASYLDKNVGTSKTVNVSGITLTGTDAGNYTVNETAATTADITVRPSSTWTGGASGNWSDAANWDALPDLSNVLAVTAPEGTSVTYDAAAGATKLESLSAAGLAIAGGSLNIANSLTVSSSFGQSGGTLSFGPDASASITQASGNLDLPLLEVANLSLEAQAGAITQSGRIAALTLNTKSQGATTLTNPDNQVSGRIDMSAGGALKLWGSGSLNLGVIDAGTNAVEIKAGGAILQASGAESGTNVIAGSAELSSIFGGAAGGLAISSNTQLTGALAASVGAEAANGGIRIMNTGAQPASVTLADNALAGASVSFWNTADISSTKDYSLKTLKGGDVALLSSGNLSWDGGSVDTPTGSVLLSADGSLAVTGALSSPVDLALSSKTAISVSGSVITTGTGTAAFTVPTGTFSNQGSVEAADDVGIIADAIDLGAGSSTGAGHDVILAAAKVTASNASVEAAHDISAAVTGDMRLNASGFTAGNDIFIKMLGASSTLYLNEVTGLARAYLWAQAPQTVHLEFPARAVGGMVVDGVAVNPLAFAAVAGGSGLFYGAAMTPATPGAGLEVVYGTGTPTTKPPPTVFDAVLAAISSSITQVTGPAAPLQFGTFGPNLGPEAGGTPDRDGIGGTKGTFGGGDEEEDEKQKDAETGLKKEADKPTANKLGTCS